jgi:hypothetical protein
MAKRKWDASASSDALDAASGRPDPVNIDPIKTGAHAFNDNALAYEIDGRMVDVERKDATIIKREDESPRRI